MNDDQTPEDSPKIRPKLVRAALQDRRFLIPSMVTVCGTFCGFVATLSSFQSQFQLACYYVLAAFILDGLDGRIARRLNATSAFGREFDSLSDVVAFGVAPAVLLYCWCFRSTADEFGVLVCFIFLICGATRLARFNVDLSHREHFVGLPIPGAAFAACALVYLSPTAVESQTAISFITVYIIALALLMISKVSYPSIKHVKFANINPRFLVLTLALGVALVWYHSRVALALSGFIYAMSGVVSALLRARSPESLEKLKQYIR